MSFPRPSRTLLMGAIVLALAIAALFLPREEATDILESRNSMEQTNQKIRARDTGPLNPNGSARSKRLSRIERLISELFPEERDIEFNNSPGDLSQSYKEKGLMDFCGQMRNALRGNEDSLAEIFTTYSAEPESYGSIINILIENLGDDFFFSKFRSSLNLSSTGFSVRSGRRSVDLLLIIRAIAVSRLPLVITARLPEVVNITRRLVSCFSSCWRRSCNLITGSGKRN